MKNYMNVVALIIIGWGSTAAWADTVRWCLDGASFSDGTALTGYFDYDTTQQIAYNRVTEFEIQSFAANEFPGQIYSASEVGSVVVDTRQSQSYNGIIFFPTKINDPTVNDNPNRLRLASVVITDSGTTYLTDFLASDVNLIDLTTYSVSYECLNCSPSRRLESGQLVRSSPLAACGATASEAKPVPALPLFGLMALGGLLGVFGFRRLRKEADFSS